MKLIRLRSIANNAVRDSIWTEFWQGNWPFEHFSFKEEFTVDLITGTITPGRDGDDVEKYYAAMSKWFHGALEKEKIPLKEIESAKIIFTLPDNVNCFIKAGGRTFESYEKWKRKQKKSK
ncbi:MAG: hypothetical protein ACFFCS_23230 [Candidatus Hodarchaeota archaeon]